MIFCSSLTHSSRAAHIPRWTRLRIYITCVSFDACYSVIVLKFLVEKNRCVEESNFFCWTWLSCWFARWNLAANASDETADDAEREQEEQDERGNAEGRLEEDNEGALDIGLVHIWLDLALQLVLVEENVGRVELVGDVISTEVIDHALCLFVFVGVLILQDGFDRCVDAIVGETFQQVALDDGNRADGEESDQDNFAEGSRAKWKIERRRVWV